MLTQEELVEQILDTLQKLDRDNPATDKLASYLYIADKRLNKYIDDLDQILDEIQKNKKSEPQTHSKRILAGKLLEQIMYLSFRGLKGVSSLKSFQSAGPQYDLVVSGDGQNWLTICKLFYLDPERRDIVIEAKAKESKLPDKDFARLCNIMELNLHGCGLGILFTLNGATGFPEDLSQRQRSLRDAKLRQVLFHAKTQKIIIVFDKKDIFSLTKNGSLISLITRKIRDLSENTGLPVVSISLEEVDLPDHLKSLYEAF